MPPMIRGDHVFLKDETFERMIGGSATVRSGATVAFKGMVNGNLVIEPGATVTLTGMVGGKIINEGTLQ